MEDARKLSDFIDLDLLQNIQDNCSKAMGLAFITVDYKGIPITKYSGFTSHCMLGRQAKGFAEMCEQCDAHGGLHAAITGQPYIYRCHADLVDFAVPLIVNGSYMGAVLGGQVRLQEESERELEHILPQRPNWKRDKEWEEAYQKLEVVTYEKVEASVKLLRDIIVTFVERRTGKGGGWSPEREGKAALGGAGGPSGPGKAGTEAGEQYGPPQDRAPLLLFCHEHYLKVSL